VITVALKTNQNERPARILCTLDKEPLNAFGNPVSEAQVKLVLAEAEVALREASCLDGFDLDTELPDHCDGGATREHLIKLWSEWNRRHLHEPISIARGFESGEETHPD
jgi:hypothetical protein